MPRTVKDVPHAWAKIASPKGRSSAEFFNPDLQQHRENVGCAKPNSPLADVNCVEEIIDLGGNVKLLTRRFTSKNNSQENYPTIFYIDGTAWVADGGEFSRWISGHLCDQSGYQVIELHTLLAPEHSILACKRSAVKLFLHFCERAKEYQIDLRKIILAGYSSGGNIADYIDTEISRKTNFVIAKKILVSPFVELSGSIEKDEKYRPLRKLADGDYDISDRFIEYWRRVAVKESNCQRPSISPFFERRPSIKTPTDVVYGARDRLLPQIVAFCDKRRDLGVDIRTFEIENGTHAGLWRKLAEVKFVASLVNFEDSTEAHTVRLDENDNSFEIIGPNSLRH